MANQTGVPTRKARIGLMLLKRHGLVREHRGGCWERLADNLTSVNLGSDIASYEERRRRDREKLDAMIQYCQAIQCRARYILGYFGEPLDPEWRCHNCDACELMDTWSDEPRQRREETRTKQTA